MTRDMKIFEINDLTTIDSTESDGGTVEITDLKEGDRVTIDVDDQNVIHRIEIEPSDETAD
jgi:3-dehydroquinate synthase class II